MKLSEKRGGNRKGGAFDDSAVITGAGSGLGRALALEWARRGWRIGVLDYNESGARETLDMVRAAGGEGEVRVCNVRRAEDVQATADHFFASWGTVGVVVNNAGVVDVGHVGDVRLENWQRIIETNLCGVIYGCHSFIPPMKAQGGGHIVNTASAAGWCNVPEMGPYNVVKAGVISLSETLRAELKPNNIGVTVICPSFFKSNLAQTMTCSDESTREQALQFLLEARSTAEGVAARVVEAVDENKLYVVPQLEARVSRLFKRLAPTLSTNLMGSAYARQERRDAGKR